jgi:hypothetical protein
MMTSLPTRTLPYLTPGGSSVRHLLAAFLRVASRSLTRLARSLSATERSHKHTPALQVFEFYAEAGAPEGALYVDGQLVGYLPGVTRL